MKLELKDLSAQFNAQREYFGSKKFGGKEISNLMANIGLPKNNQFRTFALKHGLIVKYGNAIHTQWSFAKEPVHMNRIQDALDEYYNIRRAYTKRKSVIIEDGLEDAIKYLKSKGYKIYRPITDYEEV